jgi:hypothetical protein
MKLDAWLKRDHSPSERLAVVSGFCGALVEAHQRGVVRGGLAPSGVEVDGDGSCRLDLDPPGPGSPYAAPESARGGPPTAKAEIYCAGLICYEALSGQPPALESHARKPLQDLRPDLPTDLTDAIMACLEADPDWRPADLSYLLVVVRGLQQSQPAAAARAPSRRVATPPRTFLESSPRQKSDDRGPLTRVLPVLLVLVAILATGGAWLWFEVLRPQPAASSPSASGPGRGVPSPPATLAVAPAVDETPTEVVEPAPSVAAPVPANASPPGLASPVPGATTAPPQPRAASASAPATLPTSAPSAPTAPAPTATPSAPPSPAQPEPDAAAPVRPDTEPGAPRTAEASAAEAAPASSRASIRAIAPFRLKAGAMTVLDVHGANLRDDHRAKVTVRREPAPGFSVTRYQLRNPALLLVFLQVDAGVRPGKYAFSLVAPGGDETNGFTIEVANR